MVTWIRSDHISWDKISSAACLTCTADVSELPLLRFCTLSRTLVIASIACWRRASLSSLINKMHHTCSMQVTRWSAHIPKVCKARRILFDLVFTMIANTSGRWGYGAFAESNCFHEVRCTTRMLLCQLLLLLDIFLVDLKLFLRNFFLCSSCGLRRHKNFPGINVCIGNTTSAITITAKAITITTVTIRWKWMIHLMTPTLEQWWYLNLDLAQKHLMSEYDAWEAVPLLVLGGCALAFSVGPMLSNRMES